ncbi:MAG: cell wall-binding repeat-containing protein [Firmicutes bacterium]|nr:cell wall-binding repeat-containing protein [Bacillota bacterium]
MLREFTNSRIIRMALVTVLALTIALGGPLAGAADYSAYAEGESYERYAGATRYATSIAIADKLKAELGVDNKFENIVVACGTNYPDALSGGYLAAQKNAPLIIVNKSSEASVTNYIMNNLAEGGMVYILGDVAVVSESFETGLEDEEINVKRLGGSTRYTTNIKILKEARDDLLTQRDDLKDQIAADEAELAKIGARLDELDVLVPQTEAAATTAEQNYEDAKAALKEAEDTLAADGINVDELEAAIVDAYVKLDEERTKWADAKTAANKELNTAQTIASKAGWYFINSKVTDKKTIDFWVSKAKAYSGTAATAKGSTFSSYLNNATTVGNLKVAADMITKCNEKRKLEGRSALTIDYNLMAVGVVSASLYAANAGTMGDHRFTWKVVDVSGGYPTWTDECLAWGFSDPYAQWYTNEKPTNGPHFRVIRRSDVKSAGFGWVGTKKASALEVGARSSGTVSVATFKAELDKYNTAAKTRLSNAQKKVEELKTEPESVKQAQKELNDARDTLETIGEKYGYDMNALEDEVRKTEGEYNTAVVERDNVRSEYEQLLERRLDLTQEIPGLKTSLKTAEDQIAAANIKDDELVICSGEGYADSLSASAINKPILLVGDKLTDEQLAYIGRYDIENIYVIGGTVAVKDAVVKQIKDKYAKFNVERIAGNTRYATSVAIAEKFFGTKAAAVTLTCGTNFPDGLSGGPLAVKMGTPMLLVNGTSVNAKNYVQQNGIKKAIVLGDVAVISDDEVMDILTTPIAGE